MGKSASMRSVQGCNAQVSRGMGETRRLVAQYCFDRPSTRGKFAKVPVDEKAGSHSGKGWETFTAAVLRVLTERLSPVDSADHVSGANGVVFMAWGAHAQKMCAGVDKVRLRRVCAHNQKKHLILTSAHPSPLAASRGFFGNGHFKKANALLEERYGLGGGIDWAALSEE